MYGRKRAIVFSLGNGKKLNLARLQIKTFKGQRKVRFALKSQRQSGRFVKSRANSLREVFTLGLCLLERAKNAGGMRGSITIWRAKFRAPTPGRRIGFGICRVGKENVWIARHDVTRFYVLAVP